MKTKKIIKCTIRSNLKKNNLHIPVCPINGIIQEMTGRVVHTIQNGNFYNYGWILDYDIYINFEYK